MQSPYMRMEIDTENVASYFTEPGGGLSARAAHQRHVLQPPTQHTHAVGVFRYRPCHMRVRMHLGGQNSPICAPLLSDTLVGESSTECRMRFDTIRYGIHVTCKVQEGGKAAQSRNSRSPHVQTTYAYSSRSSPKEAATGCCGCCSMCRKLQIVFDKTHILYTNTQATNGARASRAMYETP